MTDKHHDPLPTINERAGGDSAASTAHTDNVVRAQPDTSREPANNAAFTDNDVRIEPGKPPIDQRTDTVASSARAETRREFENRDSVQGSAVMTKGDNAPTFNESGLPYTAEDLDALDEGPRHGADVPAGSGATSLSTDRDAFINDVMQSGHFGDKQEAEMWTRAVFNALRQRALEADKTVASELSSVIRVGEAPEVQVEEMMWGDDYIARMRIMLEALQNPSKHDFYREVAKDAGKDAEDPWVEDAVYSFFGALKKRLGAGGDLQNLGELREVWERASA